MKDPAPSQHSISEYRNGQLHAQLGQRPSGLKQMLLSAFMPEGWPDAVTPDYSGYVFWHTVQAISSYVRGVLSSHAVFKGVGVGSQVGEGGTLGCVRSSVLPAADVVWGLSCRPPLLSGLSSR